MTAGETHDSHTTDTDLDDDLDERRVYITAGGISIASKHGVARQLAVALDNDRGFTLAANGWCPEGFRCPDEVNCGGHNWIWIPSTAVVTVTTSVPAGATLLTE